MMPTDPLPPELHRPLSVDRVTASGLEAVVEASDSERAALARRLGIPDVLALTCRFRLTPSQGGVVMAEGVLRGRLVRVCVVSLDAFEADVEERFRVRFVPAGTESDDLDPESDDEIGYSGSVIDLGEAAAEQLALGLDPYPRKPDADLPEAARAQDESPFAALARLRRDS
ncbi:YceD family protein [Limobrevibacterium gyesilva]|uniref:DUF177 domain-containing protein n=1 Tax=Limobrevibacterium gyesilva TaxID=2991712 RepID=A0AA41YP57_9PROT|nr:DUF177 domain-containing protein [Limobrevibacterium gyesilva]MCW3473950.1 DUF177 domain-containing protein [Limobrevibacterium gyesilva]